jgi:phenylpropionate dioxygenase-like ring-hydroxylating dioxygenase large terminal subunit
MLAAPPGRAREAIMLTQENNELLTRVGRGTPTGELFRQFWLPILFSWEIEADGAPERVRLLGEDLIAFRDTDGCVGLIEERCPHRGASLFFGRNEERGLTCMYHGWKYDVTGQCVEMPNEPAASSFKHKVRQPAYPCVEKGGVVWTYMGPLEEPPPLPELEWLALPQEHIVGSKRVQYTNWLQAIEGEIDQSHVSFTHSRLRAGEGPRNSTRFVNEVRAFDRHPRFEIVETEYGVCIGSGRHTPDGEEYWRVSQFMMPSHIMTGPYGEDPIRNWRFWVPIDDTNVFVIGLSFHPMHAIEGAERERLATRSGVWTISPDMRQPRPGSAFAQWHPKPTLENNFFIDRDVQKHESYSGIAEFWAQDSAPQQTMGVIYDRTREHLGTSDLGIINMRRRLTRSVEALQQGGETPPEVLNPQWYQVRSDALLIPAGESWLKATAERRKVDHAVNPASV